MSPVYVDTLLNRSVNQVACGARHTLFLFLDGRIASVGSNNKGQLGMDDRIDKECPSNVPDLHSISHIGCGSSHSLATDGEYTCSKSTQRCVQKIPFFREQMESVLYLIPHLQNILVSDWLVCSVFFFNPCN